jgi:glycosyltransferase involved in cell wall biosynthesis
MAAGVPAVATRAGGVIDFARDEDNALLVDVDDPAGLAAAIARLRADEGLRARVVASGRRTAGSLTWGRIAAEYEQVYAAALERQR